MLGVVAGAFAGGSLGIVAGGAPDAESGTGSTSGPARGGRSLDGSVSGSILGGDACSD